MEITKIKLEELKIEFKAWAGNLISLQQSLNLLIKKITKSRLSLAGFYPKMGNLLFSWITNIINLAWTKSRVGGIDSVELFSLIFT